MPDKREQLEAEEHLHRAIQRIDDMEDSLRRMKGILGRLNGKSTTASQAYQYRGELAALLRITDVVTEHLTLKARKDLTYED